MNAFRFIVAGPSGIEVYDVPDEAFEDHEKRTWWVRSSWRYDYKEREALSSPPMGPFVNHDDGTSSITIACGNYLRCVSFSPEGFRITKRRLVDRLPVYLAITSGFRVGLYRRPYSMPCFTTFCSESIPRICTLFCTKTTIWLKVEDLFNTSTPCWNRWSLSL